MNELNKAIDEAKKIIIAGHVRPDGDCALHYRDILKDFILKKMYVFI